MLALYWLSLTSACRLREVFGQISVWLCGESVTMLMPEPVPKMPVFWLELGVQLPLRASAP